MTLVLQVEGFGKRSDSTNNTVRRWERTCEYRGSVISLRFHNLCMNLCGVLHFASESQTDSVREMKQYIQRIYS